MLPHVTLSLEPRWNPAVRRHSGAGIRGLLSNNLHKGRGRKQMTERMTERLSFPITEAALRTGLPAAKLRFYAEKYHDFLGIERGPDDDWELTQQQLQFLAVLAAGGPVTEAVQVHASVDVPAGAPCDDTGSPALSDRIDDLALHLEDLSEETKQVQLLLSRIISLLDSGTRSTSSSARPWEPPELMETVSTAGPRSCDSSV